MKKFFEGLKNYALRQVKPPVSPSIWEVRRNRHSMEIESSEGEYRYFEMLRLHSAGGLNCGKIIPFFSLPMAISARRIVELGSSFTYYPETYKKHSPWDVSSSNSEGLISTRVFLTACRYLNQSGVPSVVTSVDIRKSSLFENAQRLFTDLGLRQHWNPVMETDSITWLKNEKDPIDFALVDSNHTYQQVSSELDCLVPLMSKKGIIVVDDCYNLDYQVDVDWCPNETEEGFSKGGEYGAVIEFLKNNREWRAEWFPISRISMVILRRLE